MGDSRRTGERDTGAPLVDAEGMGAILMVQNSVNLGRGKPGPGDEWRIPALPENAAAEGVAEEAAAKPSPASNRPSLLRRLTRRA